MWCVKHPETFQDKILIKKDLTQVKSFTRVFFLCGWRDSNPHASRRQILSLVRLPISPRPQLVFKKGPQR